MRYILVKNIFLIFEKTIYTMEKKYFIILSLLFSLFKGQPFDYDYSYHVPNLGYGASAIFLARSGEVYKTDGNLTSRYLSNGNFDSNFGVNGYVSMLPESKDVKEVTGSGIYSFQYNTNTSNKIVRYTLNGVPDINFGNNGVSEDIFAIGSGDVIISLVVNTDQSIYALITGNRVRKILPTGIIDPVFGTKTFNYNINLLKTSDNSLMIKYFNGNTNQTIITRYTAQGNLDVAYGNQGELPVEGGSAFVNKLNEVFILKNFATSSYKIIKYKSNGIDNSFGSNGSVNITASSFGGGNYVESFSARSLHFDSNNRLILAGSGSTFPNTLLYIFMRLKANGTFDYTFNGNLFYFAYSTQKFGAAGTPGVVLLSYDLINDDTIMCIVNRRLMSLTYRDEAIRFVKNPPPFLTTFEVGKDKDLKIYPNPVQDILNIQLGFNEKLQKVSVYSTDGRLVLTGTDEKINIGFLSSGNYLIEVETNKNRYNKKIIKK